MTIREPRTVVVHIGPHKTGSTAIQAMLEANKKMLSENGVSFLQNSSTHHAAMLLANEEFEDAEKELEQIAHQISQCGQSTVILSQEDFSGELPGRRRRKRIYPKLTKNCRVIDRALRPHQVQRCRHKQGLAQLHLQPYM